MIQFVDDDPGYPAWVAKNPDGWVLNSYRTPTASYLILHRASCRFISGSPTRGRHWTVDYSKTCGEENELRDWAWGHLGAKPAVCSRCT